MRRTVRHEEPQGSHRLLPVIASSWQLPPPGVLVRPVWQVTPGQDEVTPPRPTNSLMTLDTAAGSGTGLPSAGQQLGL